jgi:hypothetical protein
VKGGVEGGPDSGNVHSQGHYTIALTDFIIFLFSHDIWWIPIRHLQGIMRKIKTNMRILKSEMPMSGGILLFKMSCKLLRSVRV